MRSLCFFVGLGPATAWAAEEGGAPTLSVSSVFNFTVLVIGLALLLRKPVKNLLRGKRDQVQRAAEEAERLQKQAGDLAAEYEGRLAHMNEEVARILEEARKEGEREKTEILARAHKLAERIAADAKLTAEKERAHRLKELEAQTLGEALKKAEELLKTRVTQKEHRALTEELIGTLGGA